jgi:hypothetical protein
MDALRNPFAPGAGTPPPELAGRDTLLNDVLLGIARVGQGFPERSPMLVGLRGVGKTVLLERIRLRAEHEGYKTLMIEAPEEKSLPALLAPRLKTLLLQLSAVERAKDLSHAALRHLASFAKALKITYRDIEIGWDVAPEPGVADSGDLYLDLQALMTAVGQAAQAAGSVAVFLFDELQYVKPKELEAFIMALHHVGQRKLPVTVVGAGLPQLRGNLGDAKSYAERLFTFKTIGPLSREATSEAIGKPIRAQGEVIGDDALEAIYGHTRGYPYFIQEWGNHVWRTAQRSPITCAEVTAASQTAQAALDQSFFGVRFDRLTPSERKYLRAMATFGDAPCRSGEIASVLGKRVQALSPIRSQLIRKGMVWSPEHGDTAFTVPLFGEFMCRIMPGDDWIRE